MTLTLAQATPDANTVWIVIIALASVGANLATIIAVFSARGKQKREISWGFEPASKTEFEKHVEVNRREHENLFSKLGGMERGATTRMDLISSEWREFVETKFGELQESNKTGHEKLHQRINRVTVGVARLCGKMHIAMPQEDAEV
jgi:hypothetical protein